VKHFALSRRRATLESASPARTGVWARLIGETAGEKKTDGLEGTARNGEGRIARLMTKRHRVGQGKAEARSENES